MRAIFLIVVVVLGIVLGFNQVIYAYSLVSKSISSDISDLTAGPTTDYGGIQLYLFGKDGNDTSLEWEFSNKMYGFIQFENYYDESFESSSNYLVVTISANGLGGIGSYSEGQMSLLVDNEQFHIRIPEFAFTGQSDYLSLYVADDGSTYWAHHSKGPYHNNGGVRGQLIEDSLTITPSQALSIEYLAADGANIVPIPGAAWLLGIGLIGLIGLRRKNKK